jgi:hypothetical protein
LCYLIKQERHAFCSQGQKCLSIMHDRNGFPSASAYKWTQTTIQKTGFKIQKKLF